MSNLVQHAEQELRALGYSPDSEDELDLNIWTHTLEIVDVFARCGHSGGSAYFHTQVIADLLQFKALTPLTDDPQEWVEHEGVASDGGSAWQNKRDSRMFSEDGGKTYYSVDELRPRGWRRKVFGRRGKTYTSKKVNR